jgi:hypothetical protein
MSQKEELVGLQRRLVFHDAVLGDANAVSIAGAIVAINRLRVELLEGEMKAPAGNAPTSSMRGRGLGWTDSCRKA